jgi:hypothetical protein
MSFDTRLLNGLNVLAAIVEAGNFVRAGEALGLTQSGVSRAVQRLEQQLGVRLLDRTPKAVTLTNENSFIRKSLRYWQAWKQPLSTSDNLQRRSAADCGLMSTQFFLGQFSLLISVAF